MLSSPFPESFSCFLPPPMPDVILSLVAPAINLEIILDSSSCLSLTSSYLLSPPYYLLNSIHLGPFSVSVSSHGLQITNIAISLLPVLLSSVFYVAAKWDLLKCKSAYITPTVKISNDSPSPPPDSLTWHASPSPFKKWCPFALLALSFISPSTHLCSCAEPLAFSDLGSYMLLSGMPSPILFWVTPVLSLVLCLGISTFRHACLDLSPLVQG